MKRIIGIILIVVAAATGVWNFNQTQNEMELSDLAIANVEALANPEGSGNGYTELPGLICTKCKKEFTGCLYCTEDPNTCDCQVTQHSC